MIAKTSSMFHRLAEERGETLVETLVSIAISLIALLTLATVIQVQAKIIISSRDEMEAVYAAENESVRLYEVKSPTSGSPVTPTFVDPDESANVILLAYGSSGAGAAPGANVYVATEIGQADEDGNTTDAEVAERNRVMLYEYEGQGQADDS